MKKNLGLSLLKECYGSLTRFSNEDVGLVTVRTLAVAGGSQDDVNGTRKMGIILREKYKESKAAVAKGAVHAWDLQFPELFAKTVRAWIDKSDFPEGVQELL